MSARALHIAALFLLALVPASSAVAEAPKVQVFEDVEKGLELGLQGGAAYDFNAPVQHHGAGFLGGLEVGYDLNWIFRIKGGFFSEHFNGWATDSQKKNLSLDFEENTFWAGASFSLLATQRFYVYIQAGLGYMLASPQQVNSQKVSGPNDMTILVGGGLEYYPNLRHFSFALEVNVTILPIRGDAVLAVFPVVRYTFGGGEVKVIRPIKDRDGDGVPDDEDKCPDEWGTATNHGCPEPDRDHDGVPDRDDACPDEPGPASNNGCPINVDSDGDGVPDTIDKCPHEPGPASNQGCPEDDRDGDGIPDRIDKCPDEKGLPEFDGCPTKAKVKVIVKQESFELREKIHFETNKAVIKPESFPLLNQVVAAMKQHTEISKLQIEGHTDSVGSAAYNLGLSQRRAQAVVDYLVKNGVETDRLVAKGFGLERPIATNNTEQGRSMNRRVEMIILERSE